MANKKAGSPDGYETIRVRSELKGRIIKTQNRHYDTHGIKVSVSALIEEALNIRDGGASLQDPDGVAPLLMAAYYDKTHRLNGAISDLVDALKARSKVEQEDEPREEAARPRQRRGA